MALCQEDVPWMGSAAMCGSGVVYLTGEINFDGLDANVVRTGGHDVDTILD